MDSAEKVSREPAKRCLIPKEPGNQMAHPRKKGVSQDLGLAFGCPHCLPTVASAFDNTEGGAGALELSC